MAKTAAEMLAEARAQIEQRHAAGGLRRDRRRAGRVPRRPRAGRVGAPHRGAVQVPRGLLEFAADPASPRHKPELDPASRVIVYCRSGARAALAAATLKELGFENVANLDGGFTAWKDAGLPTDEHHADL